MANLPISGLTASASNLASTDLAPVVQTVGVGPVKMTGLQLAGGLLGSTTFNGSTVTTSSPVLNLTQTWNAGAVTFTGLKFNATDTASAAGSLLLDIGTGGGSYTSKFNVTKAGSINALGNLALGASRQQLIFAYASGSYATTSYTLYVDALDPASSVLGFSVGGLGLKSTGTIAWTNSSNNPLGTAGATTDLFLTRAAAATLQLGAADAAAPVAQTLLIQSGSGTDINGVAFNIGGSKSTGTGTAGLVNIQTSSRGAASGTSQNVLATVASFGPNTLSGSQAISLLDMAQTWNTSGTPTAIKLNVTDTASNAASLLLDLQVGGASKFGVSKSGSVTFAGTLYGATFSNSNSSVSLNAGGAYLTTYSDGVWVDTSADVHIGTSTTGRKLYFGSSDTILIRDASNTLALKNAGNAQIFRVYSTTASSGSYGIISAGVQPDGSTAQADTLYIGSAGAGAAMTKLALVVNGTSALSFSGTAATFAGDITATTRTLTIGNVGLASTGYLAWSSRGGFYAYGDGQFRIRNNADTGDTTLVWGSATSSFPALKRVSANLQVIAADNTASAGFIVGNQALATTATDGFLYIPTCAGTPTGVPTTQTGTAPLVVDSTNNKLYVYVGGAWTAMN